MRNKIKQLVKKEGGFTLIELLAVIAILAVIVAISIPLIGNVVQKATDSTEESQKELVIDAARLYDLETPIGPEGVTVTQLMAKGFLESDFEGTTEKVTKTTGDTGVKYEATP
ncbi:MAG: type II secretion system protein [Carnobacterium sp.]|uniref:competence type IV pilus major pilin ComGC n=1 Tax=Carnobacterium sp. TMP28 TaxID=3397060 RepID=UPI001D9E6A2B|nr:type II secretion system protein [Carnobacterium sp.]